MVARYGADVAAGAGIGRTGRGPHDRNRRARHDRRLREFCHGGAAGGVGNKSRRIAFFSLQDELARRMIVRDLGSVSFLETEAELKAFVTALWGRVPLLRSFPADTAQGPQRRSAIAGPLLRMPEIYGRLQGEAARALF